MPAPDIARPSKVEAKLFTTQLANAAATLLLTCPANSIIRIRTAYATNPTATAQVMTFAISRSAGGTYQMQSGVTIPSKNLFNITTQDDAFYLEAGDSISVAQTATTAALNIFVSYELIT